MESWKLLLSEIPFLSETLSLRTQPVFDKINMRPRSHLPMFPPIHFFLGFQHLKENTLETVSKKISWLWGLGIRRIQRSWSDKSDRAGKMATFFLEVWFAMSQLEPATPPKKLKGNMPLKSNSCLMVQLASTDKWEHVLPSFGGWTYFWSPLQLGYDVRSPCLLYGSLDVRILQAWYMGHNNRKGWSKLSLSWQIVSRTST